MLKSKSGLDWVWDGLEISESTSMHLYEHRSAVLIIGDSRWSMTKKERCMLEQVRTQDFHFCLTALTQRLVNIQGDFFRYPPKKLKYGEPRLGESTLT